jgi:SSS family solute:Na+ symporter/sodium/pantothenate symporter
MPEHVHANGYGAIAPLALLILACGCLGALAQRVVSHSSFLSGYFLGNRGLGPWALALTATVQSGGTFMGYPSLVYTYGWIVLLWIAGYMVVPLTGFGILGKRVAQLSRRSGAITVPDLFRIRFASPAAGLAASLLLLVFIMFTMIAQFKAGAIVLQTAWPGSSPLASVHDANIGNLYYIGLAIFTVTVVGYTVVGGFLASVWSDLFQSVLMAIGVVILLVLALDNAGGLEAATRHSLERLGAGYATGPGYAPTPAAPPFMPVSLAISFFLLWVLAGVGHPAGTVRLMASKDTATLRRSIVLLALYNMLIYVPLAIVCICARSVLPDLPKDMADQVIPRMALHCSIDAPGGTFLAGLILAAPFGAVMATVSTFLVVIASGLVHDVYQRFIHPGASMRTIRWATYGATIAVGAVAVLANIKPVDQLQLLIVFSGSGIGATFLVPSLMACYWRRATAAGAVAGMLAGAGMVLQLLLIGWWTGPPGAGFKPLALFGMDPIVWGVLASAVAGVLVSLLTEPPEEQLVSRLFDEPAA